MRLESVISVVSVASRILPPVLRRAALAAVLIATLAFVGLPAAQPAQAITAAPVRFFASCGNFSVQVAVNGTNDDGNGFDRFRYLIVDANGKKLYMEDAFRRVGSTVGSQVINMSYDFDGVDGPPQKNPVTFNVIDLDGNGNQIAILQQASYNADCIPAAGGVPEFIFGAPHFLKARFVAGTQLFEQPGRNPLNLTIEPGKEFFAIYRSADRGWVAVDVSGNQIVWVPAATVLVDLNRLNTPPSRIDGSDPATPASAPVVVTPVSPGPIFVPGGVATGTVTTILRMRAGPSLRAAVLTRIPAETAVPIFGRNAAATFLKVRYADLDGWVSARFVFLVDATLRDLPIVE